MGGSTTFSQPPPVGRTNANGYKDFAAPAGPPPLLLAYAIQRSNTMKGKHDRVLDDIVGGLNTLPVHMSDLGQYYTTKDGSGRMFQVPKVPFCRDPAYQQTTFCACVNSRASHPECFSKKCIDPGAYKSTLQAQTMAQSSTACPVQNNIICENINNITGGVTAGVDITQSCGVDIGGKPAAPAPAPPPQSAVARMKAGAAAQPLLLLVLVVVILAAVASSLGSSDVLGGCPGLPFKSPSGL